MTGRLVSGFVSSLRQGGKDIDASGRGMRSIDEKEFAGNNQVKTSLGKRDSQSRSVSNEERGLLKLEEELLLESWSSKENKELGEFPAESSKEVSSKQLDV